jgi:hypothetical protein
MAVLWRPPFFLNIHYRQEIDYNYMRNILNNSYAVAYVSSTVSID